MELIQKYVFVLLMVVFSTGTGCATGQRETSVEPPPRLPPTVTGPRAGARVEPIIEGKPFLGKLSSVYACMIKNTYEYMFCKRKSCDSNNLWASLGKDSGNRVVDKLGVFTAGTSGFYHYGNMGKCLLKSVGKQGRNWWSLKALELVSGLKATRGKILGDANMYTRNMIVWAATYLIPKPDDIFMGTTYGKVYHATLFRVARLFALVYFTLKPDMAREAAAYRDYFTSNPRGRGMDYLRTRYGSKTAGFYPRREDGTSLTGFHVAGFWLRRYLDGTEPELAKALGKLLRLYDPKFVKEHPRVKDL
ncbi:hypothetical protein KKF84_03990 [Myxococcota bacterium]|nr:hypothetical protein [Myxococcota bacterium]